MAKFRVNRTFRDNNGKWQIQGAIIEIALEAAKQYLVARVITPILEALLPAKKVIETTEKKIEGVENAVKNQKQKGN
jgi:hypothetical protein